MASRDVMDNRIDVWKDVYKDLQHLWRVEQSTTGNYGQVLRGNVRPSDQPEDGPLLPPLLKDEGCIDVYEAPNGFGWIAVFFATEGNVNYRRTISCHEDGPLVQTPWEVLVDVNETRTEAVVRLASTTWNYIKSPIKTWKANRRFRA